MTRLRTSLALSGILLSALLCASRTAFAGQTELPDNHKHESGPYTVASVEGDYGIVGTYAGGIAGLLGTSKTDRRGNVEGSAVVNIPGANNTRQIVPITWTGTETVNEDGTGTVELLVILPNSTQQVTMDSVITKSVVIGGVKKATEMRTMQRQPSGLTGQFVTDVLTRRPE